MKEVIRIILESKPFQNLIRFLIIGSLFSFSLETTPELKGWHPFFLTMEWITVIIFSIEYFLRVYSSKNRLDYILSFEGIVDLLSFAPFYIAMGTDLVSESFAQFFRLMRFFWLLKIARYSKAYLRLARAFQEIREEFIVYTFMTIVLVYMAAVGIYMFERDAQPENYRSVFHALWWAVATLTTVGYGDVVPVTTGGKIFTGVMLFIGLGIVSIPSALIASALVTDRTREEEDNEPSTLYFGNSKNLNIENQNLWSQQNPSISSHDNPQKKKSTHYQNLQSQQNPSTGPSGPGTQTTEGSDDEGLTEP